MNFKIWDKVELSGYGQQVFTIKRIDSDWDIYVNELSWFLKPHNVKMIWRRKTRNIGWYDCYYMITEDTIDFTFKNYRYSTTFFWEVEEFIKANESIIAWFFASKIDIEVKAIMKEFTDNFNKTISKLKEVVLPHTKDMLLSEVIEVFKDNITKVAKLFSDASIKNTLLNLFK